MAKQLNSYQVNLAFTADTESAKRQLQDLQTRLSNLTAGKRIPGMELGITKDIQEGISAAAQLKVQLEQATNINTGKLDLTKFSQSLKDSNMSIDKYANSLKKLGPQGQEAFLQLARSISSAEVPLLHVNERLNEMWVTLKNTARWQISSSILHGFMGAVQSAYGYAQDLNESLNNIRIVSGQSTEQMARFADQANKAAKALSTTTTEYTNASLIYYQQGLSDAEVQARTDITVKMAQASGQSAEIVSDQLTALWNNFYDGSQSLEHFADVLTKLGAETASSSDEISAGLEKFAAIGDMIGLSYDNAAAALATVTAQTRQSADVVGTAFKTIFARIQGLSLGETLEDGTDLNKYSEALSKVGISIFEQNGELKDMDNIIAEMGAKWKTLSKDQQIALSQTVAGVRQYNQLVAFMDNFDYYEKLLDSAQNAEGALQEQANIRAESWEAASNRVRAAMEALYQDIIDDEFFIDILNGVEKVLTGVDDLIDGLGGIKPILTIISALFLKTFSGKIVSGIKSVKDGIVSIANPEKAKQKAIATRQESIDAGTQLINDISPDSKWGEVKRQGLTQEYAIQQSLLDNAGKITLEKQKEYQIRLDSLNLMQSELEVSAKKLDKDKASYEEQKRRQLLLSKQDTNDYSEDEAREYLLKNEQMGQIVAFENQVRAAKNAKDPTKAFDKIKERIQNATTVDGNALNLNIDFDKEVQDLDSLQAKLNGIFDELFVQTEAFENIPSSIEAVGKAAHDTAKEMVELNVQGENIGSVAEELQNDINGSAEALTDWRTGLVDIAGNVAMLVGSLTALSSAWGEFETSIAEGDISGTVGSLVAMASVLPMISGGITALLGGLKLIKPTLVATTEAGVATGLTLGKIGTIAAPWLTVIAAAIAIFLPKLLDLIPTVKKAQESIQEATQAYEDQKNKLDELNSSLQTTKDRIEELSNKDTLTVVEQEELDKLKREQAYLERQIALQEKLVQAEKKTQANTIKDNYSTANKKLVNGPNEARKNMGLVGEDGFAVAETADEWFNRVTKNLDQTSEAYAQYESTYQSWVEENEKLTAEWLSENNAAIQQAEQDYQAYVDAITSGAIEKNDEELASMRETLSGVRRSVYGDAEYEATFLNPILNTAAMTQNEDSIYSQINSGTDITEIGISTRLQEELDLAGVSLNEFLTYIKDGIDRAKTQINSLEGIEDEESVKKLSELTADDWQILAELNFENIDTANELWDALDKYKNSKINIAVDGLEGVQQFLDQINAKEKPFEEMLSTYKDNGYFTMDEVDEILTANPEYVKYLQETEKGWVLTGQALKDYLQLEGQESIAIKEKIALLKEQNSVNKDYVQNYTSSWEQLANKAVDYQDSMFGGSEDQVNLFKTRTEDLKAVSEAYQAGTITAEEYFSKIDARLNGIGSGFHDLSDEIDDNVEKTDLYETTLTAATGAVADGLIDLNKQFESGSINMDEYYEGTIAGTKALMTAQAKTNKYVEKTADGTYKLVDNVDDATKSMDEYKEAAQLVEDLNSWGEQVKDAEAMKGVVDTLTGSYDYLIDYANEFGAIDFTIDNNFDTTSQQFQDMCTKMGESLTTVENENNEAYKRILAGIEAQGFELANGLNTSAEQLQAAMSQDAALASAVINASMTESGNSISSVSQAAGNVLSALGELISNFDYTLKFNPKVSGSGSGLASWAKAMFTGDYSKITFPQISMGITGSGGESVNNFVSALNESAAFLSRPDNNGMGQGGIFDYGQEPLDFSPLDPNEIETDNVRKDGKGGKDKYTPEVERYHEITRAIENQERALDDLSNAKDEAFGASKISLMEQELAQMEALKAKQQQLLTDAEKYLASDKADLMSAYPGAKIDASTGEILNFEELQKNTTSEEQNKILEQYESTIDKINEAKDALEESKRQIKSLNYEKLSYNLELKLDINDAELQKLEYFLNKYSDDFFYKMAESIALMTDKIEPVKNNLEDYKAQEEALSQAYEKGEISRSNYIEGLKEVREGYYENLETLNELNKEMLEYYENTLSAANEELDDHTDHLEHLTSVFDHYMNLMDILGKSKDYEAMGNFLQGKADTLRDQLEVQKDWVDVLVKQEADAKKALDEAIADGDEAAVEPLKKNWDAARDALDEAQDEMLSMTEEWAEAMKAVTENNMKKIADTLEKTLTGGSTFETMMDSFDKLNKRQEEYLTKTNQIYETNKLMRTASKALDETDNKVAKTKLQNFIDETKSLQENTKLSQYELDIQQAKYDLLLAEIALEEAQNAQSTVRLSRDSEGNFGYVYTADQDKIDDAQQAVDDADNRLYNLSLEGQQEYTQKYLEAQEALYGELTALQEAWLNGEIANEEEYELRKAEILNHYFGPDGVLSTYQNLYNIAVRTDAKATEDYWGKEYALMTQDTEDWKIAVDQYLKDIETETKNWQEVSTKANEDVGEALSNSKDATEDLSTESENLKKTIVENVIPGLESELEAVQDLTEEYGNNRQAILDMIEAYEEYLETIGQEIENQSNSVSYDKNTDYTGLMQGYLAAGGKKGDANWNQLEAQREAKIVGEGYTKDYYGTKVGDSDYNIQSSNAYYVDREAVDKKLKELGIDPEPYATGGYTGAWGPEGKLAVLHEKELVLNAKDTENLLTTVSFIRDLVNMIDAQAGMASLFNMYATSGVMSNSESLEQVVTIHAEFPNASDRYEIEEAFNSLVNRASQYANRK